MLESEILSLKEYQRILIQSTKRIYNRIYKFNITRNCVDDSETSEYMFLDGYKHGSSFDEIVEIASKIHVEKSFEEDFAQNYNREKIICDFNKGIDFFEIEYWRIEDGEKVWYRDISNVFKIKDEVKLMVFIENIDKRKKKEEKLREENKKDAFTNCFNKKCAESLIIAEMSKKISGNALFIVDIDDFKVINDTFGHKIGDKVLKMVSAKIKNAFNRDDIVGRLGGDEFVIFQKKSGDYKRVAKKAEEIIHSVSEIKSIGNENMNISLSIGIVEVEKNMDFENCYNKADEMMYDVKKRSKNGYKIYKK